MRFGEDEELWRVAALLHDFDYEIHPTLDKHPQDGAPILREEGYPEVVIETVLSHANHLGLPRDTLLKKTLFACDELSGFIHACGLVRPTGLEGLEPKSVRKKLKQPSFAAGVSRDDVYEGAELLGLELDEHITNVVDRAAADRRRARPAGLALISAASPSTRRSRSSSSFHQPTDARSRPVPASSRTITPRSYSAAAASAVSPAKRNETSVALARARRPPRARARAGGSRHRSVSSRARSNRPSGRSPSAASRPAERRRRSERQCRSARAPAFGSHVPAAMSYVSAPG